MINLPPFTPISCWIARPQGDFKPHKLQNLYLTRLFLDRLDSDFYVGIPYSWKATINFNLLQATFAPTSIITDMESMEMAKNFQSSMEFVELKLPLDQKSAYTAWLKSNSDKFWQLLTELGESGYKVTLSPDTDNACYIVSLIGTKNSRSNANRCMSSRSDDPFEAYMLAFYKHFVICDGSDWGKTSNDRSWG